MASKKILDTKKALVVDLSAKLNEASSFVLADYRGLTVEEDTNLRNALRAAGVEYKVTKNSLISHATVGTDLEGIKEYLSGPTAIAMSSDAIAPSKTLFEFAKKHEALQIKGGAVDGKIVDAKGIEQLAKLPSKEVLIAKMLGSMNAPISGFVNVLNGNMRGLVVALNAIAEQKEQETA